MADLTKQVVDLDGLVGATYAACAAGDKVVAPNDRTFLHIKNGDGSAHVVTVITPKEAVEGVAIADISVSVPAAGNAFLGPLPARLFGDPADSGKAAITYAATTSMTIACLTLDVI